MTAEPEAGETKALQSRVRPRDAATLVIVDRSGPAARVLMGRRRPDQVFLPNKYVFPGGRVERADRSLTVGDTLAPDELETLMLTVRGDAQAARARAFALAAVRETFEETGLLIGEPASGAKTRIPAAWLPFLDQGYVPRLAGLTFFARAITPPGRVRRYDTRFFCVAASEVAHRTQTTDGELSGVDWFTFSELTSLDLPSITRAVVRDLETHLENLSAGAARQPVPFYFHRRGVFERALVSRNLRTA